MTQDPLTGLRRADAHARWLASDFLALRPEAGAKLAAAPVFFAGWMDDDEEDDPGYCVENGVALVPIEGALMDRAGWWWDGYDAIQARIEAAHADPTVRSIMLDLDSPGGMVCGLFDCMRALRAAKVASGKRVVAWVGSSAYSAAYGLASTCDEIVTSDTAGVGSIGVIAALMSRVDQLAQDGIDVRVVSSGVEKTDGHPAVPISDGAEARLRARVSELAAMFFAEVGAGRTNLTPVALTALDGGVRYGRSAVAEGLADRVSTRAALLAEMQTALPRSTPNRPGAPMRLGASHEKITMDALFLAALAAITGVADEAAQLPALNALKAKADAHDALAANNTAAESTIAQLSSDLAAANARVEAEAQRVAAAERTQLLTAAKSDGKWSPALEPFLATLSNEQLGAYLANAPRVVPSGEHRAPSDAPRADTQVPVDVAALVAKAREQGWKSLTAREKHAITAHDKALAKSLSNG